MLDIRNCDCMDLMKEYPDKHFELAIVDPPYGIGDIRDGGHDVNRSINKYKTVSWNNQIPSKQYFDEVNRVSKSRIIWGCQYYSKYLRDDEVGRIIHDKDISMSTISQADIASCSFHKRVRVFKYKWHGFIKAGDSPFDHQRIHPCEKPVSLYEWLLTNYAKKGDKILDTHGGSMSIAIAAWNLGFDLTLCELDKDYFEAAMKRITFHQAQGRLF